MLDYADLSESDVVLEIGPGNGTLTKALAERARRVIAIELDASLVAALQRDASLPDNVELRHDDAARADYASLGPVDKVVANLPYSASSPITFALLEAGFSLAVLMYQREFAERLVATVGSPDYGRLSAACAFYAHAEILERVPRSAFSPPPEVESAIVRLARHATAPFPVGSAQTYSNLLRVLFSTRRKTLRSTLRRHAAQLGLKDWDAVERVLEARRVADLRPEQVAPPDLGALDRELEALRDGLA